LRKLHSPQCSLTPEGRQKLRERDMTRPYSVAFKRKMVERLTGKNALSAVRLAAETGVRQQNLARWLEEARSLPLVASEKRSMIKWSVEQKARVLAEGSQLTGEQLTAYLEREGVKLADFERWRVALEDDGQGPAGIAKRIRQLERELARKEKALAEAAALLVLKKQWRASTKTRTPTPKGPARDNPRGTLESPVQRGTLGASLSCGWHLGRTIERWRNHPEGDDGRCGPHHRPRNALLPVEEAQIVSVLTSSRYADLSPKQLVPQLADAGVYLASESTLYRLQRRHGLRKKKPATSRTHTTHASTVHRAAGPNKVSPCESQCPCFFAMLTPSRILEVFAVLALCCVPR
jgi:hypothetical protein